MGQSFREERDRLLGPFLTRKDIEVIGVLCMCTNVY